MLQGGGTTTNKFWGDFQLVDEGNADRKAY